jgi:hypothetical protein
MRSKALPIYIALICFGSALNAPAQRPELADDLPLIDKPWSNDSDKFSFVILGDKTSGGEGKWPIYDRAVDSINLLNPDFVITVGDMIPGHMDKRPAWDAEWAEYMAHAKRIEAPLFFTVGNHDIANLDCYQFWQEDFGRTYYSFDYKGCHFVVFNTEEERIDGRGPAWQKMMVWTRADLAAAKDARHTFIFFHKPMWDDPRFQDDWAEIESAMGTRKFTAVAGHEHYHSTSFKNGNTYVVQGATGGGIGLSEVKDWGGFHSFGHVTVDGADTRYAVVEPEGGIWPVDVAPAAFRKAITHDLVKVDALPGADFSREKTSHQVRFTLDNVLDKEVTIRVVLEEFQATGWVVPLRVDGPWRLMEGALVREETLSPSESVEVPLDLFIPRDRVSFPPNVSWSVRYDGHWIEKEGMRMVEVMTVPIHPVASYKAPETVQLIGTFPLGFIDTKPLPESPKKANAKFFHRFGPEDGYDPKATYAGGLEWKTIRPQGFGLINANALLGTLDHVAAYVSCAVYAPEAQTTHAIVAADNFSQTFVNGALVEGGQDFGAPGSFVYPELALTKGWNTVVVKLINNRADWFLRFLIADPRDELEISGEEPAE